MISDEAVEAAVHAYMQYPRTRGIDNTANMFRAALEAAAPYMRETVTEWAAGFPGAAYPYNYHRTREEAQTFVDGMEEVGADMVVMTREVLPSEASDWVPAPPNPYRSQA
jgi:hypothetical protein